MKTRMYIAGLIAIVLSSVSCKTKPEEIKIDKEKVKAEIQAIENRFANIYNTRNADSLSYYADDAVSYFSGQMPISGKDSIHRFIKEELQELPTGVTISFETLEVYVTDDGNVVAEIGAHKQTDSTGVVLRSGHYVSFFKKVDGRYLCMRDMSNSSPIENQ